MSARAPIGILVAAIAMGGAAALAQTPARDFAGDAGALMGGAVACGVEKRAIDTFAGRVGRRVDALALHEYDRAAAINDFTARALAAKDRMAAGRRPISCDEMRRAFYAMPIMKGAAP